MNYQIRKASSQDLHQMMQLLEVYNMHHIPSIEMDSLDLNCFFVAEYNNEVVGLAGYKIISKTRAKTTLLAVYPEFSGNNLGKELQHKRMEAVHKKGCTLLTTNADRPNTINWYKKHFLYTEIASEKKQCSFGLDSVGHWTTLETNLTEYFLTHTKQSKTKNDYTKKNDPHPLTPYTPLIINVCLTGMVPTKRLTPHVPISYDEIIEDAIKVYDAGARIVHIHARDKEGSPSPDPEIYSKILRGIRKERPELICGVTTSGRNWSDFDSRAAVLFLDDDIKPDMASLTLGSLNFQSGVSSNSIDMIERLAITMKERKIKPEFEIFDTGMVNLAKYLERHSLIEGSKYFNILLGNLNTAPATIRNLGEIADSLPDDSIWAGAGLGQFQLPMNTASIIAGGHVRVGIEDCVYYDCQAYTLATNEQLVKRIVHLADELQRPIATHQQTRNMLGI